MKDFTCCICGKKTNGDGAHYCMYCGSSLKGITSKQKLVVVQELNVSPEEIERLMK